MLIGITVISVLQNTRGSTLGKERAHLSENKGVKENGKMASASTICDEYCSFEA